MQFESKNEKIIWKETEMQVTQPKMGVNWDFKFYAKQFAEQFNLMP